MEAARDLTDDERRCSVPPVPGSKTPDKADVLAELDQLRTTTLSRIDELEARLRGDNDEVTGEHELLDATSDNLDASSDGSTRYVVAAGQSARAAEAQAKYDSRTTDAPLLAGAVWQAVLDACTGRALMQHEIARHTGAAAPSLGPTLEHLYGQGLLANIGTDQHPRWITRVGDNATPEKLEASVRFLCADAPRTLQELADITGARQSRVNGARLKLERNHERIVNLGSGKTARWYILHPRMRWVDKK